MIRVQRKRIAFASATIGVALLLHSGSARAASRVTPPLSVPFAGGMVLCSVLNLSDDARPMTIEVRDFQGNLVPTASCSAMNPRTDPVNAGDVEAIACTGSGYRYCRFTAKGGKATFRGILRVLDSNDATVGILVAE